MFCNIFYFLFCPQAMLAQDALEKPTNLNLYPKKRELERAIEETEAQLARSGRVDTWLYRFFFFLDEE